MRDTSVVATNPQSDAFEVSASRYDRTARSPVFLPLQLVSRAFRRRVIIFQSLILDPTVKHVSVRDAAGADHPGSA